MPATPHAANVSRQLALLLEPKGLRRDRACGWTVRATRLGHVEIALNFVHRDRDDEAFKIIDEELGKLYNIERLGRDGHWALGHPKGAEIIAVRTRTTLRIDPALIAADSYLYAGPDGDDVNFTRDRARALARQYADGGCEVTLDEATGTLTLVDGFGTHTLTPGRRPLTRAEVADIEQQRDHSLDYARRDREESARLAEALAKITDDPSRAHLLQTRVGMHADRAERAEKTADDLQARLDEEAAYIAQGAPRMTHTIAAGQTYRSNAPVPYGPARIRITEYTPGAASACAVDADNGAHCVVLAEDLFATAPTGDARHDGYTLERTA
jgi:hypothetical protein